MTDSEFLKWIHDRMVFVHSENENFDYMHRLRKIVAGTSAQPPATQTEDLAGAVWDGPNTASQVDPCMGLPSKPNHQLEN